MRKKHSEGNETATQQVVPTSAAIAASGIDTSQKFIRLMGAIMADVLNGSVNAAVGSAAVNAGGKMLKAVEMQLKYGGQGGASGLVLYGEQQQSALSSGPEDEVREAIREIEAKRRELDELEKHVRSIAK